MANILICSAGRRVALVNAFQKEAKALLGKQAKVYATDLNPITSAACQVADGDFKVGKFSDPNYGQSILDICLQKGIKIVIPTIDTELLLLAQQQDIFEQSGIHLVISDYDFIKICRDKRLTNEFFNQRNLKTPQLVNPNQPTFPMFVKPISGSMSKDVMLIRDSSAFTETLRNREDLMYMEYIPKENFDEYTCDLYYNRTGNLCCTVPRLRMEIRSGEISKGLVIRNSLIDIIHQKLAKIEGAKGCLTLQVFKHKNHDQVYGIEINPRFGGGYPMSYLAGANYPNLIIREYILGEIITPIDDWESNVLYLRYDKEVAVRNYAV
jgi:carbamoyl-phosphate synthase large subunit